MESANRTTPLLDGGGKAAAAAEDAPAVRTLRDAAVTTWEETKRLWAIGTPITVTFMSLYGTGALTLIFVGHLGNLPLAATAICLNVLSTFSFGFLLGMGSALETLCGQAFGAGQVAMLGVYMQRSWIVLLAAALLMVPVYVFAPPLLVLIGQDVTVAREAGRLALYVIPHVFALAINFPTTKFLQAQSKVLVLAWISVVSILFHVLLLHLFVNVLAWGLAGAGAAYNITLWVFTLAQVAYIVGWCRDGWRGFSWDAFQGLWAFVKLSLESALMLWLEVWYNSLLTVLTGHLRDAQITVSSIGICMNLNGWESMIFIGLNAAISVRVSNELGSSRPRAAMHAVVVVIAEALAIGLLCMALVLVFRDRFSVIYTSNAALQRAVAKIAGLLGLTMVLNSVQQVVLGVAVGGGWQGLVAYINLGCYYIFGLPLGYLFGYKLNLGVGGIWSGMLCGIALQTLILLIVVLRTDWKAEAAQASARVRLWGGQGESKPLTQHS